MRAFINNIESLTLENDFYRRVLFTAKNEQLVVMSLLPGEDIGEEVHDIDQFFRFESGQGKVVLNGKEYKVEDGSGVIVSSGIRHNIINTSNSEPLKLYTIYSKPQHPKGAKYKTKEEANMSEKELTKNVKKPMTPERARELHEKQKEYQMAHKQKKAEGKVDQTTERGKHQSEKRFNPGVQDGFAVKWIPKGWEGFEKGDIYDQHQDDEADDEMWEAKYNKYYGKDKKTKGETKMSDEPIEKAWKKFKKSYNGVAGYTQDEVDRMDAKDYSRAKDKSLENAIPRRRELAEKKKKEKIKG